MTFRSTAIADALSGSLPSLCSYIIAMTFQIHSILERPMKIHHFSINHKIYLFLLDIYEIIVCIIILGCRFFCLESFTESQMFHTLYRISDF